MKYPVVHAGIGSVGKEAMSQIRQYNQDFVYSGLFNSSGGVFSETGLSDEQIQMFLNEANTEVHAEESIQRLSAPFLFVDTTASDVTLPYMKTTLERGGAVVMANKKPIAGSQADWDELHELGGERLFYETTVGAGLPVIQTLKSLLATGDEIIEIQGCFSGTLGFLFSELESGASFSSAVHSAKEQGFTEPDARDDLSGMDVARKVLILSRIMGKNLEIGDVDVELLYDETLAAISKDEFMQQVNSLDDSYKQKAEQARQEGKVLRYVATVSPTEHSVKLLAVPTNSDIGSLNGPDNIVVFKTKRYSDNPLIIKGPGAGVTVTAAGVFADCLSAAQALQHGGAN